MKKIIFLPGMMCDERVFFPQIKYLNDLKEFKIEVARLDKFDSLERLAKNVLEKTAFSSFFLCGLSMGGILAMEIIKQAPSKVEGVVLMDTNYLPDKEEKKMLRNQQLEKIKAGKFESVIVDELKPFYLKKNFDLKAKELKKIFYQMAIDLGEETFIKQTLALRDRGNYESTLSHFDNPALIICGEADILCPPERHIAMSRLLSNSRLEIIKECGHISSLENPDEVNEIIKDWLEKLN